MSRRRSNPGNDRAIVLPASHSVKPLSVSPSDTPVWMGISLPNRFVFVSGYSYYFSFIRAAWVGWIACLLLFVRAQSFSHSQLLLQPGETCAGRLLEQSLIAADDSGAATVLP
jgi:hypothetical protein